MLQGPAGVVEFVTQFFVVQGAANGDRDMSQVFAGDILEAIQVTELAE